MGWLDVLDKELGKRGHRFVRYADDCNIYVRSQRAGERVMAGIEQFRAKHLKLKVQHGEERSRRAAGTQAPEVQLWKSIKRRFAPQTVARFKARVREMTGRTRGRSLAQIIELAHYLTGWRSYSGFSHEDGGKELRGQPRWASLPFSLTFS
jgi:RNA-directed DNA polymerase